MQKAAKTCVYDSHNLRQFFMKGGYVQVAQICRNVKKELQNGERCECKVIHIKKPTKPEKSSYTPTYSRYPHKKDSFQGGKKIKKQTNVL